jgi:hypothetical protein
MMKKQSPEDIASYCLAIVTIKFDTLRIGRLQNYVLLHAKLLAFPTGRHQSKNSLILYVVLRNEF